jgi:hypothetical protein
MATKKVKIEIELLYEDSLNKQLATYEQFVSKAREVIDQFLEQIDPSRESTRISASVEHEGFKASFDEGNCDLKI